MKAFLKGLGLAAAAGALGWTGQHVNEVLNPAYAAIVTAIIAVLGGFVVKSPSQQP